MKQDQFLEILDRDEAEQRWQRVLELAPLPGERVPLERGLGRVLAADVRAEVDVPSFDRSNLDGFALRAEDTFGASEEAPVHLRLSGETIATGVEPAFEVGAGQATPIATGGMLPRGADAVVAVEDTDLDAAGGVIVRRARVPGAAVSFAGTDIGRGETVLFAGARLTSRETGVLAAIGVAGPQSRTPPRWLRRCCSAARTAACGGTSSCAACSGPWTCSGRRTCASPPRSLPTRGTSPTPSPSWRTPV